MEIELNNSNQEDFKIVKTIKHDEKEISPIIVKDSLNREKIDASDRKAFEEYFGSTEEPGS